MDSKNDEIIELFEKTGALLKGHFVLRSGLHSGHFFQCAQVCQNMEAVTRMAELTLNKISGIEFEDRSCCHGRSGYWRGNSQTVR